MAQSADGLSYAPKLTVDDARVDWAAPAVAIDRLVRGCTPAPGAWTTFRGERIKLGPLRPAPPSGADAETAPLGPGAIEVNRRSVRVGSGSGSVLLGEVQPHGRRPMPATDWARGARIAAAERFDS